MGRFRVALCRRRRRSPVAGGGGGSPVRSDFWRHTGSFSITTAETGSKVVTYATAGTYLAQAKFIRFWSPRSNAAGAVDGAPIRVGFADHNLNQCALACWMRDGQTATTGNHMNFSSTNCFVGRDNNGTGNLDGIFQLTALGDGTFTINITEAFNLTQTICFEIMGGTAFDAHVVTMLLPTATGTFSSGALNFEPVAVEALLGSGDQTAFASITTDAGGSRGFAAGGAQACIGWSSRGSVSTPTGRSLITDQRLVAVPTRDADTVHTAVSLTSFDATGHGGGSSPGITFNRNTGTTAVPFGFVAFKGARFAVGTFLTRTNTTPWPETIWPDTNVVTYGVNLLAAPPLTALSLTPAGEVSIAMGTWGAPVQADDVTAWPGVFGGTTTGDANGLYANEAEVGALAGGNPSDTKHIVALGGGNPAGDVYLHYTRTGAGTWTKTGTLKINQAAAATFADLGLEMTDPDDAQHPVIYFATGPIIT